jgi:hypothetical protein
MKMRYFSLLIKTPINNGFTKRKTNQKPDLNINEENNNFSS